MTDELMTTRELQDFLRVDRTTIYHLLKGGQLPGFKVGGQWRFSQRDVEAWLREQGFGVSTVSTHPSPDVLPVVYVQAIQDIFAEAMGVGSIVTRLDGKPLTRISNPCAFCNLILSTPQGFQQCVHSWRALANHAAHRLRFYRCHAGLLYARSRIEVADEFVAMVFAGQVVMDEGMEEVVSRVEEVAADSGLAPEQLRDARSSIRIVTPEEAERLMSLLERLGETLSHIGQERLALLRKLRNIAEISAL